MMIDHASCSDLLEAWVRLAMWCASSPRVIDTHGRKIIRNAVFRAQLDDSLQLHHCGYRAGNASASKLKLLSRYYLNETSLEAATRDYPPMTREKHLNSVGFSTYGQQKKGFTSQGQCMQAISLTHVPKRGTSVTIAYRMADVFMRFPADLVFLRDVLLPRFDLSSAPVFEVVCHFSNLSVDPANYWILVPHLENEEITGHLREILAVDKRLHNAIIQRLGYYLTNRETKFDRFNRQRPFFYQLTTQSVRDHLMGYIRSIQ